MKKVQNTLEMHVQPLHQNISLSACLLTDLFIYFRWDLTVTFTWALCLFTCCTVYWKCSSSTKFLFAFFLACLLSALWALMDNKLMTLFPSKYM